MKRLIHGLIVSAILLSLSACHIHAETAKTEVLKKSGDIEIGKSASPFAGWSLDSKSLISLDFILQPQSGSKPDFVLVSFFATWCKPCKKGLVVMQRLLEKHKGRLALLLIASGETGKVVMDFLEGILKSAGASALPPTIGDEFLSISHRYLGKPEKGVPLSIPRSFLIDSSGNVIAIYGTAGDDFETLVEKNF